MKAILAVRKFLTKRRIIQGGFALTFLLLIGLALAAHRASTTYMQSSASLQRSYSIIQHIERVLSSLKDVESNQRAYVITGEPGFEIRTRDASRQTRNELRTLRQLFAADPHHRQFRELSQHVMERLAFSTRVLEMRRTQGFEATVQSAAIPEGVRLMEAVRSIANELIRQEQYLLSMRSMEAQNRASFARNFSLAVAIFGLLLLAAVSFLSRWLDRLQRLVTICAWSGKIRHEDRWLSLEDFLQKRYNLTVSHGISEQIAQKLLADAGIDPVPLPEQSTSHPAVSETSTATHAAIRKGGAVSSLGHSQVPSFAAMTPPVD